MDASKRGEAIQKAAEKELEREISLPKQDRSVIELLAALSFEQMQAATIGKKE